MGSQISAGVAPLSALVEEELFDKLGSAALASGNNGMACWTPQGQQWSSGLLTERELSKDCRNQANYDLPGPRCGTAAQTSSATTVIQLFSNCCTSKLKHECLIHAHNGWQSHACDVTKLNSEIRRLKSALDDATCGRYQNSGEEKAQNSPTCLSGKTEQSTNRLRSEQAQPIGCQSASRVQI